MSWLFPIGGRNIGASASASVLLMIFQGCFPVGLTGCISLLSKDSQESSPAPQFKKSIFRFSVFFMVQFSHPFVTTGKAIALTRWIFFGKEMSLLFNMLSRLVITFFPMSKGLLISWLQPPSAVIFGAQENKVCHCFYCFPIYLS